MHPALAEIGRRLHSASRSFLLRFQRLRPSAWLPLGPAGERLAARFLQRQGYRILARGHRQRLGEIDLIALDHDCLVFVEVKTWKSAAGGDPSQAVDRRKQEKLTRAALIYLKQRRLLDQPARFDVVSIVWPAQAGSQPTIRHFPHAFEAVGQWQLYR